MWFIINYDRSLEAGGGRNTPSGEKDENNGSKSSGLSDATWVGIRYFAFLFLLNSRTWSVHLLFGLTCL